MMKLFVHTVFVTSDMGVAKSLRGYLRGQYVLVNGQKARVANHTGTQVVLWMLKDRMLAVFP